jgi:hypothetical protein
VLVSTAGLLEGVLFAPTAAKGIYCFFFKGTSSGVASAGSEALFLTVGLGDEGASLLFLAAPLLVTIFLFLRILYPRNCLRFSSVTRLSNSISSNLSALTLVADQPLIFVTSSRSDILMERGFASVRSQQPPGPRHPAVFGQNRTFGTFPLLRYSKKLLLPELVVG